MKYIGEIFMLPSTLDNRSIFGAVKCDGQLLNINQYIGLYSILRNTYGGDGVETFAVPNLNNKLEVTDLIRTNQCVIEGPDGKPASIDSYEVSRTKVKDGYSFWIVTDGENIVIK